jgi:hypothetical protein
MYCWICRDDLSNNYHLLPDKDDNISITACKDYEIITVDKFEFIYHTVCSSCLTMYLDNYPIDFKKLIRRETRKLKK